MRKPNQISRRDFLWRSAVMGGVVSSPVLIAACGEDSPSPATTTAAPTTTASPTTTEAPPAAANVRFQFDWIKNVQFAGHYVAEDQGYFAAEGVKAHFAQGGGGIATEVTVNGPGIEMGASSFLSRTIDATAAGADLVVLGAALQQSPIGFIYLPDNPINTIEDLVGKRIGLQGESGIADVNTLFGVNGIEPDYENVPVGFDPSPVVEGEVDAYYAFLTNQPLALQSRGIDHGVVSLGDLGWTRYGRLWITTRTYLAENRDAVVGYMRAGIKGWEHAFADNELAVDLTVNTHGVDLGLDPANEAAQLVAQSAFMQSDVTAAKGLFWLDEATIEGEYEGLRVSGKENLPAIGDLWDQSVLEEVYAGATSLY
ncbi:MAG: ABC transporter substrate-binding protein [Acidimicrobiaceae bacterium]|nr:ABC transporter substrate-binding protein [Acidimicrobiaceae bacterium]MYF43221.1 ABC transporter substrate-binding protein [Acidimicrobiaceae bacterium]MYJ35850.1 ABC transporter substrate-binding protein [Acidimicrobiaceae bacterium]